MLKFKIFLFVLFPVFLFAGAKYDSVNITGSFNNWNQADSQYQMTDIGDGAYEITKLFYPALYKFKFNMNHSWNINFGAGDGQFSLKQNGDDIKLFINDPGFYKITLYTKFQKYSVRKVDPNQAVAYVEYKKQYYYGDNIVLDGTESLTHGKKLSYHWIQGKKNPQKISKSLRNQPVLKFQAKKIGPYQYTLQVKDTQNGIPYQIQFQVLDRYSLLSPLTANDAHNEKTFFEYKGQNIYQKILYVNATKQYDFTMIKNFEKKISHENKKLKKGKYYLISFNASTKKLQIQKKNYAKFTFNPADYPEIKNVRTVTAVGSFNNWNHEANPLIKQPNGSFQLLLPLEEGKYYYKFIVNGTQWVFDKKSEASLQISDGYGGFNSGLFVGDRAELFGQAKKNGINWEAVEHEPEELKYFNVLGKTLIEIKARTMQRDVDKISLVYFTPEKHIVQLSSKYNQYGFDYFSNIFSIPVGTKEITYYFILQDKGKKFYLAQEHTTSVPPHQQWFKKKIEITFATPDWAKGIIWYQIMPDRFRNGTDKNDPDCTIPWTWDWFKKYKCEQWDETKFNDKKYGVYGWHGIWERLFGGDMQGVEHELAYLKSLGVGGIYFNPIFESVSHHKYDTSDYRHVDDNFGFKGDNKNLNETEDPKTWKWTKSDKLFLDLIQKAHKLGMKVIIDGVFNHSGVNFWAFQDVLKNKQKSKYKDWYVIHSWNPLKYEGWGGFDSLPVYREDENGLVHGIREHIFNITKRWLDPNGDGDPSDGVDGWRLDVPNEVNQNFWKDWRKVVKSVNPDAYITGEIWENASAWLKGQHFDAVMNYEFAKIVYRFFIDTKKPYKISASQFDKQLNDLLHSYPMQVNFVLQNLLDSHDTDRILSGIQNPNRYFDGKNRLQDTNPKYDNSKPTDRTIKIYKLIQLFQFTYLGSPMIYYGDEVGMWGADDPNCRKPMWWKDLMPYDNSQYIINQDLFEHTKKVMKIHNDHSALKVGTFSSFFVDDKKEVYGFTRSNEKEKLYILLNNSDKAQKIVCDIETSKVVDLLSNKEYKVKNNKLSITLPAKYGVILK